MRRQRQRDDLAVHLIEPRQDLHHEADDGDRRRSRSSSVQRPRARRARARSRCGSTTASTSDSTIELQEILVARHEDVSRRGPADDEHDAEDAVQRGPDRRDRRERDARGALPARARAREQREQRRQSRTPMTRLRTISLGGVLAARRPVRREQLLLVLHERMRGAVRRRGPARRERGPAAAPGGTTLPTR